MFFVECLGLGEGKEGETVVAFSHREITRWQYHGRKTRAIADTSNDKGECGRRVCKKRIIERINQVVMMSLTACKIRESRHQRQHCR
jgi:hypothetical protein